VSIRKNMNSTLAQIGLAIAILGGAGVITHFFARAMYITCPKCRTLNARRRSSAAAAVRICDSLSGSASEVQ
jgi:hypothetical protein